MATDYTGKGYWGKCLEVDLSAKKITVTDRHMKYLDDYAGGRALGMKLLWEALKDKPGYDPMGPDAPIMFIAGPLTGSAVAFSSRYMVVNKSALTRPKQSPYATAGGIGYAACGGHFGPNLKWAGFDMIYITGDSDKPLLLKIDDNEAELVDATDFWGMDIPEAQELAKERYGVEFATAFFGPAAENGVRWADVAGDTGRAAARSGAAVVLAHRQLKGIIARGSQCPPMADMDKVLELRQTYYNALYSWTGLEAFRRWGTLLNTSTNGFGGKGATKNHQYGESPYQVVAGIQYYHNNYIVRHRTCVGCVTRCMKFGIVKSGQYKGTIFEGPDYEGGIMNGHNWLLKTGEEVAYVAEYVESQGMDCINTGAVVGFIIEAVEKGFIQESQLGFTGLTWGATDAIHQLLTNIIYNHKNPFYDAARLGCMPLVDWIVTNNKADYDTVYNITAQCKNNGFAAWWAGKATGQAVNYSLSTRGSCHMFGAMWGEWGGLTAVRDIGVYCTFGSQGGVSGYAYYELLNASMGRNLTSDQWNLHGLRNVLLEKAFNTNEGFRTRDDWASERVFDPEPMTHDNGEPTVYGGACVTREWLKEQIATWYAGAGCDPETGCPTKGKMQEMGMEDVIPYMEKALTVTGEALK